MNRLALLLGILLAAGSLAATPIPEAQATRAIVGEAANQGYRGMLAVAGAIRNRGTLQGVYGGRSSMPDRQPNWVWQQARAAWRESATNDITLGATHWENVTAFGNPAWAGSMQLTIIVKDHRFFRSPDR
jgi:hypothetical protein